MSTTVAFPRLTRSHGQIREVYACKPQPKRVQQSSPREDLKYVVHTFLRVEDHPDSPLTISEEKHTIPVTVFDGSSGKKVPLIVRSIDTIGKLKQACENEMPHLKGSLELAFNGKHYDSEKTMCELNVKSGATFVTFQRCVGG